MSPGCTSNSLMVSAPLAPKGAVGGGGEVPGACAICPPLLAASRSNCTDTHESGKHNHSVQLMHVPTEHHSIFNGRKHLCIIPGRRE